MYNLLIQKNKNMKYTKDNIQLENQFLFIGDINLQKIGQ